MYPFEYMETNPGLKELHNHIPNSGNFLTHLINKPCDIQH